MASKKPSGAWFVKQRKLKESNNKSLSASLSKWLQKSSSKENLVVPLETDTKDEIKIKENSTTIESDTNNEIKITENTTTIESDTNDEIQIEKQGNTKNVDFNDPAKWPKITLRLKAILIEHGPPISSTRNYYPHDENNRHFSNKWFFRKLTNGEQVRRQWLMYSVSKNKLFCFPCILFCTTNRAFVSGFDDWQH